MNSRPATVVGGNDMKRYNPQPEKVTVRRRRLRRFGISGIADGKTKRYEHTVNLTRDHTGHVRTLSKETGRALDRSHHIMGSTGHPVDAGAPEVTVRVFP